MAGSSNRHEALAAAAAAAAVAQQAVAAQQRERDHSQIPPLHPADEVGLAESCGVVGVREGCSNYNSAGEEDPDGDVDQEDLSRHMSRQESPENLTIGSSNHSTSSPGSSSTAPVSSNNGAGSSSGRSNQVNFLILNYNFSL